MAVVEQPVEDGGRQNCLIEAPSTLAHASVAAHENRSSRLDRRDGMPQNTSRINAVAPAAGDMAFYPVLCDALPPRPSVACAPRQAGERAVSRQVDPCPAD